MKGTKMIAGDKKWDQIDTKLLKYRDLIVSKWLNLGSNFAVQ